MVVVVRSYRWPAVAIQRNDLLSSADALNSRTTDASDNQLAGAGLDGSAYLPATITSHHPLDLVIIMRGTNDLKPAHNRTPYRIALGAGTVISTDGVDGLHLSAEAQKKLGGLRRR
jgi:lysophospholipase L1-like esterase